MGRLILWRVIGIVQAFLGGLGVAGACFMLLVLILRTMGTGPFGQAPSLGTIGQMPPALDAVYMGLGLAISGLRLASGVGLLGDRSWARSATAIYALAALLAAASVYASQYVLPAFGVTAPSAVGSVLTRGFWVWLAFSVGYPILLLALLWWIPPVAKVRAAGYDGSQQAGEA